MYRQFVIKGRWDELEEILVSWNGTPRVSGQAVKGVGADCIGFVSSVVEEVTSTNLKAATASLSFRDRRDTLKTLKEFLVRYECDVIEGDELKPGDVLLVGKKLNRIEHALIVGNNGFWHCGNRGICMTGLILPNYYTHVKILRYKNKKV